MKQLINQLQIIAEKHSNESIKFKGTKTMYCRHRFPRSHKHTYIHAKARSYVTQTFVLCIQISGYLTKNERTTKQMNLMKISAKFYFVFFYP